MRNIKREITIEMEDIYSFEEYLVERENAIATIQKYTSNIRTFYTFLDGRMLVDKALLLEYKKYLMEAYEVSSANSMLVALNQYLEFLGAGYLKVNRIKTQRQPFASVEKEITKKEYEQLVKGARASNKKRLAMAMETICSTGIRVSELEYFTVERIKAGRIKVYNKGKLRTILLTATLKMRLLYYAQQNQVKKGCIFVTKTGKSLNRSNLWKEMKALGKQVNVSVEKIFPHNLRHLFARTYYSITTDLLGLADLLGHSSLETTRIYAATSEDVYQDRIENMGLI